jgi:hypothetical protein
MLAWKYKFRHTVHKSLALQNLHKRNVTGLQLADIKRLLITRCKTLLGCPHFFPKYSLHVRDSIPKHETQAV